MQRIADKINTEAEREACAYILSEIAWAQLNLGLMDETRTITDKVAGILDTITGADQVVYSSYYRVLSLYYKVHFLIDEIWDDLNEIEKSGTE